jgi:hypothetical protein
MQLRSQLRALATLTPVKEYVVPYRRLDEPQSQSNILKKYLLVPGQTWMMIPQSSRL